MAMSIGEKVAAMRRMAVAELRRSLLHAGRRAPRRGRPAASRAEAPQATRTPAEQTVTQRCDVSRFCLARGRLLNRYTYRCGTGRVLTKSVGRGLHAQ